MSVRYKIGPTFRLHRSKIQGKRFDTYVACRETIVRPTYIPMLLFLSDQP